MSSFRCIKKEVRPRSPNSKLERHSGRFQGSSGHFGRGWVQRYLKIPIYISELPWNILSVQYLDVYLERKKSAKSVRSEIVGRNCDCFQCESFQSYNGLALTFPTVANVWQVRKCSKFIHFIQIHKSLI